MLSTPPSGARLRADRILVIRLGALGDVVRTRFAFGGLRALYPDATIDWLVEDRAASGLAGMVGLDDAIVVPRAKVELHRPASWVGVPTRVVSELRARSYDLAVDFHSILKSALLAHSARIPQRVGYANGREGARYLFTHRVPAPPHASRFERNAAMVRFLGGDAPSTAPELALPEAAFAPCGDLPHDFFVLHPGTSGGTEYKRWEPERFGEVARLLHARTRIESVVTWGPVPGERECAEAVVASSAGVARLAPRTRSVEELLAVLSRARLFVGADSGPVHLASLAGAPVVVLFGPTDRVENAPFAGQGDSGQRYGARTVFADVGCNPCRLGRPARSCMRAVSADAVVAAACELVAGPGSAD